VRLEKAPADGARAEPQFAVQGTAPGLPRRPRLLQYGARFRGRPERTR
jgi:hypothetical protein